MSTAEHEARSELNARLHNALFGDCCGYDLEHAKTLTPCIVANAKRLRLLSALKRLRNDNLWPNNPAQTPEGPQAP